MEPISLLVLVVSVLSARFLPSYSHASVSPLLGVHPLDEKHYEGEMIECRDSFGFFFQKMMISATASMELMSPEWIDCCDGSDEYGGSITCPNTCIMEGNVEYKLKSHDLHTQTSVVDRKKKNTLKSKDSLTKVEGLKTVISLQVVLVCLLIILCLCRQQPKGKRRRTRASAGYIIGS